MIRNKPEFSSIFTSYLFVLLFGFKTVQDMVFEVKSLPGSRLFEPMLHFISARVAMNNPIISYYSI